MRSNSVLGPWMKLMIIGLTVICFSGQLAIPVAASPAPSQSLSRLALMTSAHFSNEEQVQEEIDNLGQPVHLFFTLTFQPICMDLFQQNMTFFCEQTKNGRLLRRHIMVAGEDDTGLIYLKPYNLTGNFPNSPGSVDVSQLKTLTFNDLEYTNGCDLTYSDVDKGVFFYKWPECKRFTPESNVYYPDVLTCDGEYFLSSPQMATQVPHLLKTIQRFQIPSCFYGGIHNKKHPCL